MGKALKKYWPVMAGILIGAVGGWVYWRLVGCAAGSCPITSSPINSSLWGAVMGGLLSGLFIPQRKTKDV